MKLDEIFCFGYSYILHSKQQHNNVFKVPEVHRLQPDLLCLRGTALSARGLVVLEKRNGNLVRHNWAAVRPHRHALPFLVLHRHGHDRQPEFQSQLEVFRGNRNAALRILLYVLLDDILNRAHLQLRSNCCNDVFERIIPKYGLARSYGRSRKLVRQR